MNAYFFKPIFQERIWGGAKLKELFGRDVPEGKKIGESWELVDRPEACSEIIEGPGIGANSRQTITRFGKPSGLKSSAREAPDLARFPILIKLLDCQENLSVQVHPPAGQEGEPKTEMWYFLDCTEDAKIYAGLKKGITREKFEKAMGTPELAGMLATLKTEPCEAMFLPSGRVHAIGGGNVILEVQQNSDTTYRVDDWGSRRRPGPAARASSRAGHGVDPLQRF